MPIRAKTFQKAGIVFSARNASRPSCRGCIDTEHLFAFMIGTDVGTVGEREFQSTTTGRFAKNGGGSSGGQ